MLAVLSANVFQTRQNAGVHLKTIGVGSLVPISVNSLPISVAGHEILSISMYFVSFRIDAVPTLAEAIHLSARTVRPHAPL